MGRGQGSEHPDEAGITRVRRNEFPLPQLSITNPLADLYSLGPEQIEVDEQAIFADYLAAEPIRVDGRSGDKDIARHTHMEPYIDASGPVLAVAMNRRFIVECDACSERGTVGDYLVQMPDGSARAIRRREFLTGYRPRTESVAPSSLQVPLADARQALIDGDLEAAFATLRSVGPALERNVCVRELSESLLEASWQNASATAGGRSLAERVTDWLGRSAAFATT